MKKKFNHKYLTSYKPFKIIRVLIIGTIATILISEMMNLIISTTAFDHAMVIIRYVYMSALIGTLGIIHYESYSISRRERCSKCRHHKAMSVINVHNRRQSEEDNRTYTYNIVRQCKYCGYIDNVEETVAVPKLWPKNLIYTHIPLQKSDITGQICIKRRKQFVE